MTPTPVDTKTRKHFTKKVKDGTGKVIEVDAFKVLRPDCVITFFKVGSVSVASCDSDLRSF
jgi:hypothetical protein